MQSENISKVVKSCSSSEDSLSTSTIHQGIGKSVLETLQNLFSGVPRRNITIPHVIRLLTSRRRGQTSVLTDSEYRRQLEITETLKPKFDRRGVLGSTLRKWPKNVSNSRKERKSSGKNNVAEDTSEESEIEGNESLHLMQREILGDEAI
jgi:hypothetical protein